MNTEEEIWKDIPGYDKYQASSKGRIRSKNRTLIVSDPKYNRIYQTTRSETILKTSYNHRGYLRVDMRNTDRTAGKTEAVHRLVAMAFLSNTDKLTQVNHINGIKDDNCIENLEWCTNLHNNRHARSMGLYDYAMTRFKHRKLDDTQVRTIRKCLADGMRYQPLADYFKVKRSTIKHIKLGRTWASLL